MVIPLTTNSTVVTFENGLGVATARDGVRVPERGLDQGATPAGLFDRALQFGDGLIVIATMRVTQSQVKSRVDEVVVHLQRSE